MCVCVSECVGGWVVVVIVDWLVGWLFDRFFIYKVLVCERNVSIYV